MIKKMYLKELKQFFRKPFNVIFMLVTPLILILLMGYAMSNVLGSSKTKIPSNGKALYVVEEDATAEYQQNFSDFKNAAATDMNIHFTEITDYKEGCKTVDEHQAIALINISADGFYYYRSPYNEPTQSKMLRSAYQISVGSSTFTVPTSYTTTKAVHQETINSYTYFTFAELGLLIIYISLIVGQSVFAEKETRTLERIYTSKANIGKMLCSKIALGCTVGLIQTSLVYCLSTFVLDVDWGQHTPLIFIQYLFVALFSSTFGAVLGLITKRKTVLNDRIMVLSIMVGFLGGGLTPLTFLDSIKIVSLICKISPLYWTTNSAISLSSGAISNEFFISIAACLLLTALLMGVYQLARKKEKVQGVHVYG